MSCSINTPFHCAGAARDSGVDLEENHLRFIFLPTPINLVLHICVHSINSRGTPTKTLIMLGTHNPLAVTFGLLGNIISFLVYLAPLPTFRRIYKKKATEGFQSLPYLVALFSSSLWLYYAMLKTDAILLITINSFGIAIELIYIVMYIIYAHEDAKKLTIKLFVVMNVGSFALVFFVTFFALHDPLRIEILGWICVVVSVSVFVAPLSIMAQVVRTKSVQFMPFTLSFCLTLNAIMWFGYGHFLDDKHVTYPNVLGFALGVIQMVLYMIYKKGEKKEQTLDGVRNVVGVNPNMGSAEVFPIPESDDANSNGHVEDDVYVDPKLQVHEEKTVDVEANDCPV